MYFTYIIYSESLGKYYKGHTSNIEKRLIRHNSGSERYTSSGVPWELVLAIPKLNRSEAVILEKKLKNLNKERLEDFIEKYK